MGQRIPTNVPTNPYPNQPIPGTEFGNPEAVQDSIEEFFERDSFVGSYYYINNFNTHYKYTDTTLRTTSMWYDKANNPYHLRANLGNNGSASIPMVFDVGQSVGFNTGFRQYEQYKIHQDSFKFYNSNRPMADLTFSPILGSQQNFTVGANYAQKFSDGFSVSINFHRINQEGFYTNSFTKATNFGIAIRKEWDQSRFTSFVSMTSNVHDDEINGGVTTDSLFTLANYNFRTRIPVFLSGANHRYDEKSISLVNYYRLGDSIASENDFYLKHNLSYDYEKYKFFDTTSIDRTDYYGEQYAFDERGLRMFLSVNKVKNSFAILGQYKQKYSGQIGILHELITINNDVTQSFRNDITAFGLGKIDISKTLQLNVHARIGLGSNIGKFDIDGNTNINVGKWANLNLGARFYNLESPYVYSNFMINGQNIFQNERINQTGLNLFGTLHIPLTKTTIRVAQNVSNNAIIWDSLSRPVIIDGGLVQLSSKISQDFRWRFLHSEHFAMLQAYNSDLIRLPTWYSYHNFYIRTKVFRKILDLKVGGEHLFIPSYKGLNYSPVIGQFINSDIIIPQFSQTNAFLQGKISNFQIFIKVENLQQYINGKVQYQIGQFPHLDGRLRLGIRWLLLD
jgi:hypothetical protein